MTRYVPCTVTDLHRLPSAGLPALPDHPTLESPVVRSAPRACPPAICGFHFAQFPFASRQGTYSSGADRYPALVEEGPPLQMGPFFLSTVVGGGIPSATALTSGLVTAQLNLALVLRVAHEELQNGPLFLVPQPKGLHWLPIVLACAAMGFVASALRQGRGTISPRSRLQIRRQ